MGKDNEHQSAVDPLLHQRTLTRELAEGARDALKSVSGDISLRVLSPGNIVREVRRKQSPATSEWREFVSGLNAGEKAGITYCWDRIGQFGIRTLEQFNTAPDEVLDDPFVGPTRSPFLKAMRNGPRI